VGIKVPFVADVSGFLRGTADMEDALEDVADSLDDLARTDSRAVEGDLQNVGAAAERAGEDVEDLGKRFIDLSRVDTSGVEAEVKEIGTAGDAAAEKLETSFKSAFDTLKAEGRTASQRTKADLQDTGTAGSATMQEFKQEAKQNVSETISSFNGSASSAVDAIQGTLGGLVSALGPAGIVGVAAAGIGIGLARSMFGKSQEAAEAFRSRVLDIFDELRESGDITPEFKSDTLAGIISDAEQLSKAFDVDNVKDFQDVLNDTGLSVGQLQTYFSGLTGDASELERAQSLLEQQVLALHDALLDPSASLSQQTQARDQITAIGVLNAALDDQGSAYADARTKAELLNQLMPETTDAAKDEAQAHEESAAALVSENEQLRIAAGLKGDAVANELDMRDALDAVTKARKDNGQSLSKNTEAGRDNLRAIKNAIDGITDYGDALVDNGTSSKTATRLMEEQEQVLVNKVAKAFGISEKAAKTYIERLGGIPPAKDTKVTVDDHGTAKKTADEIDNTIPEFKDLPIRVTYTPDPNLIKDIQKHLNSYTYGVKVYTRPGKNVPQ
jgi:hypothetical protein